MKKQIARIVILVSLIFISDRILGLYLDHLYSNNFHNYSNGHLNFYLKKVDCDTLLLGSSRMMHAINPDEFGTKTYLIGQHSKHLGWFASVIDLMEQHHKLPKKTLIVNIEPSDFNPHYDEKLNEDVHYLKYYYSSNSFIRKEINKQSPFEFIKFFSSCFKHNGEGIHLITNPIQGIHSLPQNKGFSPIEPTSTDKLRVLKTIKDKDNTQPIQISNATGLFYLKHIESICKKNKLTLIVITAPKYFPSKYDIQSGKTLSTFMKKRNIPYFNYNLDKISKLIDLKYWHDNTHFNRRGATLYSEHVFKDINNLSQPQPSVKQASDVTSNE